MNHQNLLFRKCWKLFWATLNSHCLTCWGHKKNIINFSTLSPCCSTGVIWLSNQTKIGVKQGFLILWQAIVTFQNSGTGGKILDPNFSQVSWGSYNQINGITKISFEISAVWWHSASKCRPKFKSTRTYRDCPIGLIGCLDVAFIFLRYSRILKIIWKYWFIYVCVR